MSAGARTVLHVVLALLATLSIASPAFAQDVDRVPPNIDFEPLGEGRRGDTQVFSARVADEGGAVERVTLHFRAAGTTDYSSRDMRPLAGTDIYTVTIDDLDPEATGIEFYLDARDESGNRSIEGFAFDPLVRRLVGPDPPSVPAPVEAPPESAPPPIAADGLSTRRKILYGVLGVVAVGAIAAAAGGGGGGGGEADVPVTIVADPL